MNRTCRTRNTLGVFLAAAVAVVTGQPEAAAQSVWSGAGVDGSWSTGPNWVGGVAPASANTTVTTFGPAATTFAPVVDAPWTVNRMDLTGATPYLLTGGLITFDGAAPQINISGGPHVIANNLSFAATTTFDSSIDLVMTGQVAGLAGLTKTGAGRLTLAGSPFTWGGTTTVSAGTLQIGNGASGPNSFLAPIVVNGAIDFAGTVPDTQISGTVSGTGTFTVSGGTLTGPGTPLQHAGATTVSAGTLNAVIDNDAPLVIGAAGALNSGGSTVGSLSGAGAWNMLADNTVGSDNTSTTFSGQLAGVGGLTKVGTGRLTLAGSPLSWGGTTTVSAGTLQIGNGASGPNSFSAPIIVNGAIDFAGTVPDTQISGTVSGTGTFTVSGGTLTGPGTPLQHAGATTVSAGTLNAVIDNDAPLVIGAAGTLNSGGSTVGSLSGAGAWNMLADNTVGGDDTSTTFSGQLAGVGGLTKVGTGRLTLAGSPLSWGGTTTVSAGTLQIGNGASGPNSFFAPIIVNGAIDFAGTVPDTQISGTVSGTGTFTVSGGTLTGPGTPLQHAGATTVSAGTLNAVIDNDAPLVIGAAGTLNSGGSTVGSLSGAGAWNMLADNTVGGDDTSTTFSGQLAGVGGLTKVGIGTLTLSGANTNTGTMTANAGSLLLTGTLSGPVVVNAGGRFGGTGTVNGPVTTNAGGTLAPGLSPGIINTGSLTLGGIFLVEIEGTTLGLQYDNANVTGTVSVTGGTLTLAGVHVPVDGNTFTLITNDGADPVVGTFVGLAEGATIDFSGVPMRVTYVGGTGNDVVLTATAPGAGVPAIPTVTEWGLLILALLTGGAGLAATRLRLASAP